MKPGRGGYRFFAFIWTLLVFFLALAGSHSFFAFHPFWPGGLFFLVWFAVMLGIGIYAITGRGYLPTKEIKRLCLYGTAVPGTFTGYQTGRSATRFIEYTFQHPRANFKMVESALAPNDAALQKLKAGDAVTVLYDPDDPENNTVYETCGYEVVGGFEVERN